MNAAACRSLKSCWSTSEFFPEMLYRMSEALTITKMHSFKHETSFSCSGGGGGGGVLIKIKKQAPASIIAYYLKVSVPQVTSVSTLDQPLQPQL